MLQIKEMIVNTKYNLRCHTVIIISVCMRVGVCVCVHACVCVCVCVSLCAMCACIVQI